MYCSFNLLSSRRGSSGAVTTPMEQGRTIPSLQCNHTWTSALQNRKDTDYYLAQSSSPLLSSCRNQWGQCNRYSVLLSRERHEYEFKIVTPKESSKGTTFPQKHQSRLPTRSSNPHNCGRNTNYLSKRGPWGCQTTSRHHTDACLAHGVVE